MAAQIKGKKNKVSRKNKTTDVAPKAKRKSRPVSVATIATRAKKKAEASAEAIDRILLKLAPGPYSQVLRKIATGKRRIDEERRLALQLGTRILDKAKEVRDSLMPRGRSRN